MKKNLKIFIEKNFMNKKIMFCGLGKSNLPLLQILTNKYGIPVIAYDHNSEEKIDLNTLNILRKNKYVSLRLADETVWSESFDIVIRTPGISFFSENIEKIRKNGAVVTSEMEIFFDICPCKIIGITGSDGKTTVTTIISELLKNQGYTVHLGGNIGKPLLPEIEKIHEKDFAVVELSSFQLMSMRKSPDISVVTNISPNHLDVHHDMQEYINSKKQIILHQNAFSKSVLNYDNKETKKFSTDVRGQTNFFSISKELTNGIWIDPEGNIINSFEKNKKIIMNKSEIILPGNHNLENYLAAISAISELVSTETIKQVASKFNGVEHRLEFVRTINGVNFYNDSIASSPTRVIKGTLSLFDDKIILIAGGYDKKIPFDELAEKINEKVTSLILLGKASEKIKNAIMSSKNYNKNKLKIIETDSMENAVKFAKKIAQTGDTVVLSPACASFDMYKNFEERGNHFKSIVKNL